MDAFGFNAQEGTLSIAPITLTGIPNQTSFNVSLSADVEAFTSDWHVTQSRTSSTLDRQSFNQDWQESLVTSPALRSATIQKTSARAQDISIDELTGLKKGRSLTNVTTANASNKVDQYLVGDWNGDGRDDLAYRQGSTVFMDTNADGKIDRKQVYALGSDLTTNTWSSDLPDNPSIKADRNGIIRLTDSSLQQSNFILNDKTFKAADGLSLSFEFSAYGGTSAIGADGISFFLVDAGAKPTQSGGTGGSLGYAPRQGQAGLVGGYLGIGFDGYGNFSNPIEGKADGPGFTPDAIAIRGSAASGYKYLTGTSTLSPLDRTGQNTRDSSLHRAQIDITSKGLVSVQVDLNNDGDFNDINEKPITNFDVTATIANNAPLPSRFKIGFAGSTGNLNNIHELQQITLNDGAVDPKDEYLVGDWDGDGKDDLGIRRGDRFYLDTNRDGKADLVQSLTIGQPADQYLVGDFDGDGKDNLIIRQDSTVYIDTNFDGKVDFQQMYGLGKPEDQYLVGDFDGDGKDNVTVRRGSKVLMDANFNGKQDFVQIYGLGKAEDQYLNGDWDGDGDDNLAVRRDNKVFMDRDFDGKHDMEQAIGPSLEQPKPTPPDSSSPFKPLIPQLVNAVTPPLRQYAQSSIPAILQECEDRKITDGGQIAYILATARHESLMGKLMIEQADGRAYEGRKDLGNTQPGDGPRFKGRGFVQITGRTNYTDWSKRLSVNLVGNPEKAADPNIAAKILVEGMRLGTFTGKKLSDYITDDKRDFVNARRIVNGTDKANQIADYARTFYDVLT